MTTLFMMCNLKKCLGIKFILGGGSLEADQESHGPSWIRMLFCCVGSGRENISLRTGKDC